MTHQTLTITDPREFDGNPYEVAELAVLQAGALARLLQTTTAAARVLVRNAELERQLAQGDKCDAAAFENGVQARKLDAVIEQAEAAEATLTLLARAAAFNPKAPLTKG